MDVTVRIMCQKTDHRKPDQFVLDMSSTDTVGDIKRILEDRFEMPIIYQKLTFGGKVLKNEDTLSEVVTNIGRPADADFQKVVKWLPTRMGINLERENPGLPCEI